MQLTSQYFRANAGIVILDDKDRALLLERSDIPGAWQLPQGGLRPSEEPLEAAKRELREETGISLKKVELMGEVPEWITYELPPEARSAKTGRGQAQKWFVFRFVGADEDIDLCHDSREFSAFKWVEIDTLVESVPDFRKPVYRRLVESLNQGTYRINQE